MPKAGKIDLHGIDREVRAVQSALKAAAQDETAAEKRRIAGIVKKLESIRLNTSKLCPKGWGVYPPTSAAKKGPAKPKG
jgi:hypothetical protein